MKKIAIGFLGGIAAFTICSFAINYEPNQSTAEVKKVNDLYVFTDCKPVMAFEQIGNEKLSSLSIHAGGNPNKIQRIITEKVKKNYPDAHAIIYDGDAESAEIIRFK